MMRIVSLLWAALLSLTASAVGAQSLVLDVSPLRVQLHAKPGAEYTNAIQVTNSGSDPVRLQAYINDWTMNEAGTPSFRTAGSLNGTSSLWVDSAPSDFLLDPGEQEFVRFTIRVPTDAADGGYHTAILLESIPIGRAEPERPHVIVNGRVACIIYVTVGDPERSARIRSFTVEHQEGKAVMELVVENTGKDFIRLAGDACLVVDGGQENNRVELPDVPVLPGLTRRIELQLPDDVEAVASAVARVTIEVADTGVLVGECPFYFDRAQASPAR